MLTECTIYNWKPPHLGLARFRVCNQCLKKYNTEVPEFEIIRKNLLGKCEDCQEEFKGKGDI